MKILITGATGLIGKKLTSDLLSEGYSVNYLTTRNSQIKSSNKINGYYWNPEKEIIDLECFKDVDTIINLAGSNIAKRWSRSNKLKILKSRTQSLNLLKDSILKNNLNIKKIISASAIGIYPSSFDRVYTENTNLISSSFLGKVVREWELAVNSFNDLKIEIAIVRIGLVLSKDGGILSKSLFPIKFGVGSFFGSGMQWQSWIHIQDISNIFCHILKNDLVGIFNGTSPNPITNKDFTIKLSKFLNRPLIFPNLPKWLMSLILGEMHIIIFESQNITCDRLNKTKFKFKFDDFDHAIADLLK
ncbi:TIGR01777 family oxidoreductase [Flavobacteriaceae bacterium]|nr:TIGR01777 family oxidoreductase [Flavobacteriaceae bacterium]|tara:strand:+ start:202 stop:1107 length:906 start_codon:yes stop_codon:yes gene_type:complete